MPMPDGSHELRDALAVKAMHGRLVEYGLCWIRGGAGRAEQIVQMRDKKTGEIDEVLLRRGIRDEDPGLDRREWTRPQVERACRLHRLICALPLQHSIVVQVFYGEWVAECWDDINPDRKAAILRDLTHWRGRPKGVNARIAEANIHRRTNTAGIWPGKFLDLLHDGIRMLINAERRKM